MAFPPPQVRISDFTFGPITSAHRESSPYNFVSTVYDFMGDAWSAEISLTHTSAPNSNLVLAWLTSLKGPKVSFELPVFDYAGPANISLNPVVAAPVPARSELLRVHMAADEAFSVGEFLTLGRHLHIVTAAPAPLLHVQELTVWPRLRRDQTTGAAIEAVAPFGTWALADQKNTYSRRSNGARSQRLSLVEAL